MTGQIGGIIACFLIVWSVYLKKIPTEMRFMVLLLYRIIIKDHF